MEKYEKPTLEIIFLELGDVVTLSQGEDKGDSEEFEDLFGGWGYDQ